MNDLLGTLSQQMSGQVVDQISKQLAVDPKTAQSAINTALPMLLGAISRNAASPQGAQALDKALNQHDGAILNDLLHAVTNQAQTADGAKILGHVFGNRQANVQQGLSQLSGIAPDTSAQLLAILAPVVMGALGQTKRSNGFGADDLATLLGGQRQNFDGPLGNLVGLLDMDGDGSIVDDVMGMGSKLLGGFFGKKS
ncbi:MAG: DUF937 domain-containing protein [Caldilineaceae bacterium]